jgi:AcrR family transcriptional regulator
MSVAVPAYPEPVATQRTDSLFFRGLEPSVASSQRARMLDAVVRAVAERGYARVTVADVVGGAGVSRRTFYEHFEDKQDCFLAAYRTGVEETIRQILEATAQESDDDWRAKLRVGLEAYTHALASEPEFARTLLVDVLGAGREAVELRQQLYELFVTRFHNLSEQAVAQDPVIKPVPDVFLRALVGGIGELVQQHVIAHGAAGLEELTPTLVQVAQTVIEFGGMRA